MRFLQDPILLVYLIPSLLIALTFHEYAHARVAYAYGDITAKSQGRLTLNPISHLDPIGTLMILIVGFGWARPVPINPLKFREFRKGLLWVSLAGPLTNFVLGFISMLILTFLLRFGLTNELFINFMFTLVQLNIILGVFNLLPIPPLDGSKILSSMLPSSSLGFYRQIEPYAPLILIMLIVLGVLGPLLWGLTEFILNLYQFIISILIFF